MNDIVLSKEWYLKYLQERYLERLKEIVWGGNIHTEKRNLVEAMREAVDTALLFTTEGMSEKVWTVMQKNAFEDCLISWGFTMRMEGKKNKQLQNLWAFPINTENEILQEIRSLYEKSFQDARRAFMDKARDEIREFCNSKSEIQVIKSENSLYRECMRIQLQPGVGPNFLKKKETSHGEWMLLSKTDNFFNLIHDYERDFRRYISYDIELFLKEVNSIIAFYEERLNNTNTSKDALILPNKFITYFSISAAQEISKRFEEMGIKMTYFPTSYETDYMPLNFKIKASSYLKVFIQINGCKSIDLPYGRSVNAAYKKFCKYYQ